MADTLVNQPGFGSETASVSGLSDRLEVYRARYEQCGNEDASKHRILRTVEAEFYPQYPRGTAIVLALDSFKFVSAARRTDALRAFIDRFGGKSKGWAFDVGRTVVVGGGVCPT